MKNIGQMMKQAQEMQTRMAMAQENIAALEATGVSGGGLVEVTVSGKGEMRALKIDSSISNSGDHEMLEDLIIAAHNDAKSKLKQRTSEEISKITGGVNLHPGFKFPL